jgi:acyl carrier protein
MAQIGLANPYYNVTLGIRLKFALDVMSLDRAFTALVERHEILRTRYPLIEGLPVQEIMPADDWKMRHSTVEPTGGAEEREKIFERFTSKLARTRLKLDTGPVFIAHLLSIAQDDHLLVLVTHHIAIDQWTINLLTRELEILYESAVKEKKFFLPPAKQYREYVAWETHRWHKREKALFSYWDSQLKDAPAPLSLPRDRDGAARSSGKGREYIFHISNEETGEFISFLRQHKSTLFMGVFAAWAGLLYCWCKQERMIIGTTTAFRENMDFNNTAGCFVNTLAIPMQIPAPATFPDVLKQSRKQVLGALAHYDFSYERMVERIRQLQPGHDGRLVNAYIQFQPAALSSNGAAKFHPNRHIHNGRAKFELMLNISQRASGLDCVLEYDSGMFTAKRARRLAETFRELITKCPKYPDRDIKNIVSRQPEQRKFPVTKKPKIREPQTNELPSDCFTASEQRLAEIWHKLLLVDSISRNDDFLLLGGHSLLLAQLAWRIREEFGVSISIAKLHEVTKLRKMAALIAGTRRQDYAAPSRPGQEINHVGGIPCQLELGSWTVNKLDRLIRKFNKTHPNAAERFSRIAWQFWGTPFQFESRRPLPLPGRLPVRFGSFDCITFVYTSLAAAAAKNFEDFVHKLYLLRYDKSKGGYIDSHPESGNIFDFAEESLLLNAVEQGFLRNVTSEIAAGAELKNLSSTLFPVKRALTVDPMELWATPKLGRPVIAADFLPVAELRHVDYTSRLVSGDIILMSRGNVDQGYLIDHLGISWVESGETNLLQSTRHFAWREEDGTSVDTPYTGIYYDPERKREQIGVGLAGLYAGDSVSFEREGIQYFGYHAGTRRTMRNYLEDNFKYFLVLRPAF